MRRTVFALFALFALTPLARAAEPDNPTLDGKTMTQWMAIVRESDNGRVRKAAVSALAQIAADNAVGNPKLVRDIVVAAGAALRSDVSAGVRAESARLLARVAAELLNEKGLETAGTAVVALTEAVRTEKDADARYEQAVALQRYGDVAKGAVSALGAAAADADPKVKAAAATALGRIGKDAKNALDDLLPLVKSDNAEVRKAAVFALGRVDPDDIAKVSDAISKFTTDPDEQTRKEAISSLCLLRDKSPDTVKAVAAALGDKSVEVRRMAAAGLGRFESGARDVSADLLAAFKKDGEDSLVKAYALHSLCSVTSGEDAVKLVPEMTARLDPTVEKDAEVRIAICDEIGGMGPDAQSAVPALRVAQKDPKDKVRDAATFALKRVIAKKEEKKPEEKKDK